MTVRNSEIKKQRARRVEVWGPPPNTRHSPSSYSLCHFRHLSSKWWLLHHARWLNRMANAELSLTAFIIQLIMTFHQQWVYISKKTFYDPVLNNDYMNRNFTFGGLWDYCTTHYYYNESSEKDDSFYFFLEVAKISFLLSLGSSLLLTCWFHCVFNPMVKHSHVFDWSGGLGSLLTACFIFITLVLFAIHLWLQEMNMKKRLIFGRSYYLGWLVFLIYVLCELLGK
ncbi:outer dense fiber protein 4 isoform X2 [Sarcophilus harrisii]|uniref:outer dense fiber protein 4 isoform X2 n=1 Tax=Sarcophilus harrisii TaxID=9305 RepID=UPI001301BB9D|nr:outer dense fiber protein 4 isoform X2 [Sarcophilus harrisii]